MDPVILRLLGLLEQMQEAQGVPNQDGVVNKNVIKSNNSTFESDKRKKGGLDSKDKKTLIESNNLFNKMFFDYQKKMQSDTKEKTLVSSIAKSQQKQMPSPIPTKEAKGGSGFLKTLLGGLGILGGIIAFLYGVMTDGPLKGIMKVLSKLLSSGGMKMLSMALSKLMGYVGKIFKFPLEIISKFGKGFFGNLAKGVGGILTKILPKGAKGFFGKLAGSILKVLKPAAKLLKRIPVIGTLISVGFAISRFKSGDTVGGIIDVLSGLVGLLDMIVPGLGFGLSMGLDVLNAFLDVKAGGASKEASKKKSDILWDMAKGLGSWIWEHAEYIPVLGTIKWFGKAYDSFASGSYLEGIKQIGLGLVSIVPGGGFLIKGVEMLMGFFSGSREKDPTLTVNKSWYSKLKDWVKSKLKDLPWWIKKPLSWFGIMEDDSGVTSGVFDSVGNGVKVGFEKTKEFISGIWDNIKGPIGDSISIIGDFSSDTWKKTKEFASKAWDKAKEAGSWFTDTISSMANKTKDMVNEWIPKIVDTISGIADSAMEVLKNIANKIGGWITGLFSSEDEKKIKEVKTPVSEAENFLSKDSSETAHMLIKGNITSNTWLENIHKSSIEQVRLLGMLVNVGNSSLSELKRMSGNSSGGGGGTVIMSPPQQSKTPMMSIDNNRMGYATSAYSLG